MINIKSGPGTARKRQTWPAVSKKAQKSQRNAKTPAAVTITTAERTLWQQIFRFNTIASLIMVLKVSCAVRSCKVISRKSEFSKLLLLFVREYAGNGARLR
jgi:hypothetical protein